MMRKALLSFLMLFSLVAATVPAVQEADAVATAIGVQPPAGRVGDRVRFTGSVTQPGDRYELWWESHQSGILLASGITVTSVVSAEFAVPEAARREYPVVLIDIDDLSQASARFNVLSSIAIDRTSGPVGSRVTVTGNGFGANEAGIRIVFDGTEIASAPNANARGTWSASFDVPIAAKGDHLITAFGSVTPAAEAPPVRFTVAPNISISPTAGAAGSQIVVSGTGFAGLESGITVIFDGNPVRSDIRADAKGSWSYTHTLPPGISKGSHTVTARGNISLSSEVPTAALTVSSTIKLTPDSGTVGTRVTVSGAGFATSERDIVITFDGVLVKEEITADGNGNWSAAFDVPRAARGRHSIRASGGVTPGGDVPPITFTVAPKVGGGPLSGSIGTEVTMSGTGLDSQRTITVTFDDAPIGSEIQTTRDGSFDLKFKIPVTKAGTHNIAVKDQSGNLAQLTFTVSAEPPKSPQPVAPEPGVRLTMFGGAVTTFEWTAATGQTNVTYIFELSQSPDFARPLLTKTDLTNTTYTLTAREALDRGMYYWRVRAVDAVGNQSGWSPVQSLEVGVMALWVFILAIVGGIAVIGIIVFFVLRRRGGYNF